MRIPAGLAAIAALSAGLCAFAEPQPRYTATGRLCTAEEAANPNPPIVKHTVNGRTFKSRLVCRTAGEWRVSRIARAEQQRYNERGLAAMMNTPGYRYYAPRPEGNGQRLR